jgi:hypothetical protein
VHTLAFCRTFHSNYLTFFYSILFYSFNVVILWQVTIPGSCSVHGSLQPGGRCLHSGIYPTKPRTKINKFTHLFYPTLFESLGTRVHCFSSPCDWKVRGPRFETVGYFCGRGLVITLLGHTASFSKGYQLH